MNEIIARNTIDIDMIASKFGGTVTYSISDADGTEEVKYNFKTKEGSRRFNAAVKVWIEANGREHNE